VALEELCRQLNTNIDALQTIVEALEKKDYVTNVSPVREDGEIVGYTISFANSDTITIYNGKDGVDGKDGYTPQIGVMKDTDGIYYWTVDGEWLLDGKGNKIQANGVNGIDGTDGSNGEDGTNGVDGITPRLKIENDYWYVSYDGGATWTELGKASGEDGADGIDGDNIFKEVFMGDGFVVFTLSDNSQIKLPFLTDTQLTINVTTAGTLKNSLTLEEQRSVTSLKIKGYINKDDLIFINTYLHSLEILDISDAIYICSNLGFTITINPLGEIAVNRNLRHVIVGNVLGKQGSASDPVIDGAVIDPSYCIALETLTMTADNSKIYLSALKQSTGWPNSGGISGCPNLYRLVISEGVKKMAVGGVWDQIYCVCPVVELPSTIEMIGTKVFGCFCCSTIVCRALVPPGIFLPPGNYADGYREEPILTTDFDNAYEQMEKMILYVPAESIDVYKTTSGWSKFGTILPIE
ncbi:MAG: hypothetical protein IIW45_06810, partial [Alistipes sp.]|nr:hypothetical protein [Alistipes sp.]